MSAQSKTQIILETLTTHREPITAKQLLNSMTDAQQAIIGGSHNLSSSLTWMSKKQLVHAIPGKPGAAKTWALGAAPQAVEPIASPAQQNPAMTRSSIFDRACRYIDRKIDRKQKQVRI